MIPILVYLADAPTVTKLDPAKDYTIVLPAGEKHGSTVIIGGHDVTIRDGRLRVAKGDVTRRALYVKDATGTVTVENVAIDVSDAEADGIAISAPKADVIVRKVRIVGVRGWLRSWHADCLQPFGGAKSLLVEDFTCRTGYQGIQFTALTGPLGPVTLRRVNIVGTGRQVWLNGKNGGNGGFLLWFECGLASPVKLEQVYLKPRSVRGSKLAAYPSADGATRCPARLEGKTISFPGLPVSGGVTVGMPKGGDFASEVVK